MLSQQREDGESWDNSPPSLSIVAKSPDPLIVDLAPAQPVSEEDLRSWAGDQHVFVSSVMAGMSDERAAVVSAIERIGAHPVVFERFGGRDDDPERAYITEVAKSDVYVGILGERYGRPLSSGYSATHAEYLEAVRRGLRISVWVSDGEFAGHQREFIDEVRVFRTTGAYSSPNDLAVGVDRRLRQLAAEALSPWVKIGNVVFRARRVVYNGKTLRVEARIRDDRVVASVEALRPHGFWGGPSELRATWSGRTEFVAIKTVESETAPARGSRISLEAERTEAPGNRPMVFDVAVSGRSSEDLTETAVRVSLLGEPSPLGPTMGFMVRMANPFDVIEPMSLPEDAIEPIAHLLLTEELVGSGRADRITALQIGPRHRGTRPIALAWMPVKRFSNVTPTERCIFGHVIAGAGSVA